MKKTDKTKQKKIILSGLGLVVLGVLVVGGVYVSGGFSRVADQGSILAEPEHKTEIEPEPVVLTEYQQCMQRGDRLFETGFVEYGWYHPIACNEVFVEGDKDEVKQFYASNKKKSINPITSKTLEQYETYRNVAFPDFTPESATG